MLYHDVEVDVLAGFHGGKKGQVLRLQLVQVVQYGPRIKTSLSNGDVILDSWWGVRRVTTRS